MRDFCHQAGINAWSTRLHARLWRPCYGPETDPAFSKPLLEIDVRDLSERARLKAERILWAAPQPR